MTEPTVSTTPRAQTLRAVIERITADTLADCSQCGKCFEACPMPAYSSVLEGQAAGEVVGGILGLLRGAAGSPAALEWVRLCTGSARCIPACPEGVNPMLMLRVARIKALGSLGDPPQMTLPEDPHYFRKVHAFASMHFTDAEIDAWQR